MPRDSSLVQQREELVGPRLREIGPRLGAIQGWLTPQCAGTLYRLVRFVAPTPVVVELGAWKGRSSACIGYALRDRGGGRLVSVDTWKGSADEPQHRELLAGYDDDQLYREFLANVEREGLADLVEPWRMTTLEAADRWDRGITIGLLYIDAGHSYAEVRSDFERWSPFVVDGGLIVFDDVPSWEGPTRLVSELPRWYRLVETSPNQVTYTKLPP